jgi:hypothetical protein
MSQNECPCHDCPCEPCDCPIHSGRCDPSCKLCPNYVSPFDIPPFESPPLSPTYSNEGSSPLTSSILDKESQRYNERFCVGCYDDLCERCNFGESTEGIVRSAHEVESKAISILRSSTGYTDAEVTHYLQSSVPVDGSWSTLPILYIKLLCLEDYSLVTRLHRYSNATVEGISAAVHRFKVRM